MFETTKNLVWPAKSTKYLFFRLSYHQRIKDMMPESLTSLVPAKPEPTYKYSMEGAGKKIIIINRIYFITCLSLSLTKLIFTL